MKRRIASALATAALAAAALVSTATPAAAAPNQAPANRIQCPDYARNTFGEYNHVRRHGTVVDEYFTSTGVAMAVYAIDGHYEVFGTNGASIGRICYDNKPPRLENEKPAEQQLVGRGGGGGVDPAPGGRSGISNGGGSGWAMSTRTIHWTITIRHK